MAHSFKKKFSLMSSLYTEVAKLAPKLIKVTHFIDVISAAPFKCKPFYKTKQFLAQN